MLIEIPGFGDLNIEHIVCDYNGTLAAAGITPEGVKVLLNRLAEKYKVHVITADTFGTVERELQGVNCSIVIIPGTNQTRAKLDYITGLGADRCAAIGNGSNDRFMLKEAALGICLMGDEGAFTGAMLESEIICRNISDALNLFLETKRLIATLRS